MVKLPLFWPDCTLTVRGTVATEGALLVSDTDAPPQGAVLLNATVPLELTPLTTLVGVRVNEAMVVAALAESGANTEMAINTARILVTNIDPFSLDIFPALHLSVGLGFN